MEDKPRITVLMTIITRIKTPLLSFCGKHGNQRHRWINKPNVERTLTCQRMRPAGVWAALCGGCQRWRGSSWAGHGIWTQRCRSPAPVSRPGRPPRTALGGSGSRSGWWARQVARPGPVGTAHLCLPAHYLSLGPSLGELPLVPRPLRRKEDRLLLFFTDIKSCTYISTRVGWTSLWTRGTLSAPRSIMTKTK